jgi:branched-chain amino acid transport system permease protein
MSGPVSNLNPRVRTSFSDPRFGIIIGGLIILILLPWIAYEADDTFLISFVAKMMIFAIAAATLDLILGYGGMVSFGHAAYIGVGAYAVAVSAKYFGDICGELDEPAKCSYWWLANGYFQFVVAIVGSALIALLIGAMSLRTSGIYFIMITLAFTQMLFFLGVSLEEFGGDDGMNVDRSDFGFFNLNDNVFAPADGDKDGAAIYYFALVLLILSVFTLRRIVNSRFGMVVRGSYSNPIRMRAIGFPVFRYRLTAFVIAGAICGVAGALFANHQEFLTPEYMLWIRSGEIMIMVIMGGVGTIFGPVFGAIGFLAIEEFLQDIVGQEFWMIVFGPLLVVLVLFAKRGLFGLIPDSWNAMPKFAVGFIIFLFCFLVFCAHLKVFGALWIILSWIFVICFAKALFELVRLPRDIVIAATGGLLLVSNMVAWVTQGIKPGWGWLFGGSPAAWAVLLTVIILGITVLLLGGGRLRARMGETPTGSEA